MEKRKRLIIISVAILFMLSVVLNIVSYSSYKYHKEVHRRYEMGLYSYAGNIFGNAGSIEDTLLTIMDKKYMTYMDCIFLKNEFRYLNENFNSLKEILKVVYIYGFESYDLYGTNEFKYEWVEPSHDLLIPAYQLFSATLKEFSRTDEQISLSSLKLITNTKLTHLNDITSSIEIIIDDNEKRLSEITDLKSRIRIRLKEVNEISILLESNEDFINSLFKE